MAADLTARDAPLAILAALHKVGQLCNEDTSFLLVTLLLVYVMTSQTDPLFLERLDIFMEKCLTEMRDFARREERDLEQVCIT